MMGRDNITAVMMAILMVLLAVGLAFAIPPVINYQGKLVDSVGDPVNDSVDITFTIYNAPTGGDVLWTETQAVGVVNGIFNVYLGSISTIPDSTFSTDAVYLSIKVGTNAEMTPRQLYSATPYAFRAHTADMVADGAVTSAMITNGTIIGTDIAADSITSNEIATGAVASSEIEDGTITGSDIAADTITASNIATGGVGTSEILDNSIGSIDIADGTITGADISAVASISASKIDTTGLDADTLDGLDSTVFSRKYEKVAVVALSGGDYTSPVDAVSDLANWCGTPSMTNPCLIKVMPGVYDIGTDSVVLQPLLSIEGSGINSTAIMGTIDSTVAGVIVGADTSEIKHLTVQNNGGGTNAVAIYNNGPGDPRIYDVRADASGATNCYTIRNEGGVSTEIRTVKAYAGCTNDNTAIFNNDASPTIENTSVDAGVGSGAAYGIYSRNGSTALMSNVRAYASSIITSSIGVSYESSTGEMYNVISKAEGYYPKGVDIQQNSEVTMQNVTAKVEDLSGSEPIGVNIISSVVTMKNITATTLSGGGDTRGINISSSEVDMENVSAEANMSASTGVAIGIRADASSGDTVRMKNISVNTTGGDYCYGIYAVGVQNVYMPMTDVQVWSMDGATGSVGIWAGNSSVDGGDFGMKNVEAYGMSGSGSNSYGIWLNNAYAGMQGVEALGNRSYYNYGIYAKDSEIEGVDVRTQGEGGATGYNYGLFLDSSTGKTANITGGRIKSHGGSNGFGVYLGGSSSSVELTGVKVEANNASEMYGIYAAAGGSGSISVDSSRIEVDAPSYTVYTDGSGYSTTIGSTRLRGVKPYAFGGGTLSCASSYHDMGSSLVAAASDCQ